MELKLKNNNFSKNASLVFKVLYLTSGFLSFNSLTANSTFLTYYSYLVTLVGVCYFFY